MTGTPPVPNQLAHRLLSHVAGGDESPVAYIAAAESAFTRLRAGLSVFFGQAGFDSLWARAMSVASRSVAEGDGAGEDALMLRAPGWSDALSGRNPNETRSIVVAAFTSFIGLLFTFVGAELGSRLLHQVWPELPLDEPSTSTGDVTR